MRSALAARSISQYLHSTPYLHRTIIGPVIMGIVGNLRTMQLEELLQWLSQSKKSGTLEIVHGRTEKKIFFKDGLILSSASNKPEEYLGHFLVSHGLINEGQLSRADRAAGEEPHAAGDDPGQQRRHRRAGPRPHAPPQGRGEHLRHLRLGRGGLPLPRRRAARQRHGADAAGRHRHRDGGGAAGGRVAAHPPGDPQRAGHPGGDRRPLDRARGRPGERRILAPGRRPAHHRGDPPARRTRPSTRSARSSSTSGSSAA